MWKLLQTLLVVGFVTGPQVVHAFSDGASYLGLGYFSETAVNRQTASESGKTGLLGSASYPLLLKHDWKIGMETFFSPTLSYTAIARESAAGSAKVTLLHLMLPFGYNFANSHWDWYVGPGILRRTIKGKGGTVALSNGGGSATFALPGRTVHLQNYTLNFGASYNQASWRFAFDLVTEGLLSDKRNYNLMLSCLYAFSGGGY